MRLRADEDRRCRRRPTRLILAPCSGRSRRGLATPEPAASQVRRPALTRPCARHDRRSAGRDEGTALGSNKGTARYWAVLLISGLALIATGESTLRFRSFVPRADARFIDDEVL